MPWKPEQATRFTKKAKTPEAKRQWAHIADSGLMRGLSDAEAIAEANGVIKKDARSTKSRGWE